MRKNNIRALIVALQDANQRNSVLLSQALNRSARK